MEKIDNIQHPFFGGNEGGQGRGEELMLNMTQACFWRDYNNMISKWDLKY